jgi:hypothetical protein
MEPVDEATAAEGDSHNEAVWTEANATVSPGRPGRPKRRPAASRAGADGGSRSQALLLPADGASMSYEPLDIPTSMEDDDEVGDDTVEVEDSPEADE